MTTNTESGRPRGRVEALPDDHPFADILAKATQAARSGVPVEQMRDHILGMINAYVDACEPITRARGYLLETIAINQAPEGQQAQARKAANELEAAYLEMATEMNMAIVRAWYPRREVRA